MQTVVRKQFTGAMFEIAAQRAELFIAQQTDGAGTWPDGQEVSIHTVVRGGTLRVCDKIGENNGPAMRHIELRRGTMLIVTFVYNHYTRQLVRTF